MAGTKHDRSLLKLASLTELFEEIGRRLNIRYGRLQMVFRSGKPTGIANVDRQIKLMEFDEQSES